jgi:hypothetical protein
MPDCLLRLCVFRGQELESGRSEEELNEVYKECHGDQDLIGQFMYLEVRGEGPMDRPIVIAELAHRTYEPSSSLY